MKGNKNPNKEYMSIKYINRALRLTIASGVFAASSFLFFVSALAGGAVTKNNLKDYKAEVSRSPEYQEYKLEKQEEYNQQLFNGEINNEVYTSKINNLKDIDAYLNSEGTAVQLEKYKDLKDKKEILPSAFCLVGSGLLLSCSVCVIASNKYRKKSHEESKKEVLARYEELLRKEQLENNENEMED